MTDANTASATTLASDAGMAGAANGGGQGSTAASADPLAGLQDAGIRERVGKSGFKDITPQSFEGLAKKARDAESLISSQATMRRMKNSPSSTTASVARKKPMRMSSSCPMGCRQTSTTMPS